MSENRTIEEMLSDDREKLIVDIRKEESFKRDTCPGAVNIYWMEFDSRIDELPGDMPIYILCYTGVRGEEIAKRYNGKYEIYNLTGGYSAYLRYKTENMLVVDEGTSQKCKDVEKSIVKKFKKDIWRKFTKAINEYELIKDGDRIAVCISGGKDSMLMAKLFQELERHGVKNFEVVYLVMNPGYNDINYTTIMNNAKLLNVPVNVFETQIFDTVVDIKDSPCYLCARMRRGYLYSKAEEFGCNKIALGHHYDDVIETILMSMLYGGQIQTMMPKLYSTNFTGMELIRPLYLIRERDIIHWARYNELNFIQCACRFTEQNETRDETQKGSKRSEVKELIRQLEAKDSIVAKNIFKSVENVNLKTIVAYKESGVRHHFLDNYDSDMQE